ncbi:serine protease [Bacillus thuringiensis]|uniref:S1 family peptidase n=1 Tax=Bacillus thuringiensis TaxID=1428 RepID=UPI000BF74769|nr:serine protease [Bacillus thuringiensis]PFB75638.1 serine protease [Bacillus thuringiensis]
MHSVTDDMLYITVRLEGETSTGSSSVGTGFYFSYKQRYFVVTNKHVVHDVVKGTFILNKGTGTGTDWAPLIGYGTKIPFENSDFHGHPNPNIDVTIMNITHYVLQLRKSGENPFFMSLTEDIIPTQEDVDNSITAIEDILFIGYPNGIWDSENLLPIVRKGITATPYYRNFNSEPIFLIDASVFPGSSGSPVFIFNQWSHRNKNGELINKSKLHFLGIIARTYFKTEDGEIISKNIPVATKQISRSIQMIDIGIVYNASTVIECLEDYYVINNLLE